MGRNHITSHTPWVWLFSWTKEWRKQMTERVNIAGESKITGNAVGTLRCWRVTNQGPRSYVVGRRLYYDLADLDAWLERQKAQSVRGGVASSPIVSASSGDTAGGNRNVYMTDELLPATADNVKDYE